VRVGVSAEALAQAGGSALLYRETIPSFRYRSVIVGIKYFSKALRKS
jgi:hypothetical protein